MDIWLPTCAGLAKTRIELVETKDPNIIVNGEDFAQLF